MWIIFIIIIFWVIFLYKMYFNDYINVKNVFGTLEKTLDTRDLLVMKLLPEIHDKKLQGNITMMIEERMKNKVIPYNDKINLDVRLNRELKSFYENIDKNRNNMIIESTFKSILDLEKKLKKIRDEYNYAVEKYNMNLIMHKFICVRCFHMKPLDTYSHK